MEKEKIQELIFRFNNQQATDEEVEQIEGLLEQGTIALHQLNEINWLDDQVGKIAYPGPSPDLDDRFYQMLALERKVKSSFSWRGFFSWPELAPKLALASVMLIVGIGLGYLMNTGTNQDTKQLGEQLSELREMMMLNLLEKETASDRLKAVSLSQDMNEASAKVTGALLETLNNDENVNVRLAALEALKPYVRDSHVRTELIRSIAQQESPLVQVSLAEIMAELQVRSSVKELEKIVQSDKTPADVKSRIKQSIDILI